MVKVGDIIVINDEKEVIITDVLKNNDNRWAIFYRELNNDNRGYFLEGDDTFKIIVKGKNKVLL